MQQTPEMRQTLLCGDSLTISANEVLQASSIAHWLVVEKGTLCVFFAFKDEDGLGRRHFVCTLGGGDYFPRCSEVEIASLDGENDGRSPRAGVQKSPNAQSRRFCCLLVPQTQVRCKMLNAPEACGLGDTLERLIKTMNAQVRLSEEALCECLALKEPRAVLDAFMRRAAASFEKEAFLRQEELQGEALEQETLLFEKFARLEGIASEKENSSAGQPQLIRSKASSGDELFAALKIIARKNALAIEVEPEDERGADPEKRLLDFCLANHWRSRRVELESGFSGLHHPAMIGFYGDEARVCILELDADNSVWYFAEDNVRHPLRREDEKLFKGFAYAFYESFEKRPLSARDIASFVLRSSRKTFASILFAGTLAGLFSLVPPIATAYVTGKIIPTANYTELWQLLVLMLSLSLGTVILNTVPQLCVLIWGSRVLERFLAALYDRILRLPVNFFQKHSAGDLCSRLFAAVQLQETFFQVVSQQFIGALFSLLSLAVLFYYSAKLALAAVALALVYAGILMLILTRMRVPLRVAADRAGWQAGFLKQVFEGIVKIQGAGAEERVQNRFLEEFALEKRARMSYLRAAGWVAVMTVAVPSALNLIFFFLIGKTWRGSLEVADFLAFLTAFGSFEAALGSIVMGLWELASQKPEAERLMVFFKSALETPAGKPRAGRLDGSVEMSHVAFGYAKDAPPVLKDITLSIAPGEFVAVVGPSGSGKSSLIRLLLGFETPDKGSILYSGRDLRELDVDSVRRQLGVILQNSRIMPGSIYENIAAGTDCSLKQAEEALRLAALDKDVAAMPMGIHTNIADGLISGGQQQRVLIARALAGKPSIIIMDESTSALDNETQEKIRLNIEKLKATRIVVAHRLSTIINADRIYVLAAGVIAESGTFEELMRRDGLFKKLAQRQLL